MRVVLRVLHGALPQNHAALETLDVSDNAFSTFPGQLVANSAYFDTLTSLRIRSAALRSIPMAVAEDWAQLRAYLLDLRLQASTPVPHITLGVVGHGGHGKTTLVQRVALEDQADSVLWASAYSLLSWRRALHAVLVDLSRWTLAHVRTWARNIKLQEEVGVLWRCDEPVIDPLFAGAGVLGAGVGARAARG